MLKSLTGLFLVLGFFILSYSLVFAQTPSVTIDPTDEPIASEDASVATISAEEQVQLDQLKKENLTQPEEPQVKKEVVALFEKRPIKQLTVFNFIAYAVQYSVYQGVPSNTIILIFLLPFLATIFVFVRHIIGFPSLEMWVPIALSITLVATGLTAGTILLVTILLASTFARILLKRIRVMQLSKMALSLWIVAIFVFIVLTASAAAGILTVRQLSIFPILLLILLSEKVVTLQLTRSPRETFDITVITLLLGILGYGVLSLDIIRDKILLYPEMILLLLPINILIGRYFGLRLTEYFRFSYLRSYANKQ